MCCCRKWTKKITANNDVLLQKMDEKITASNDVLLQKMDEKIAASNEVLLRQTGVLMDEKIAASNEVLLRGVNVIVENKYDEILKLLREDYGPVAAAARDTARKVADYDALKNKVRDHDRALQSHRKELDALKKRAI